MNHSDKENVLQINLKDVRRKNSRTFASVGGMTPTTLVPFENSISIDKRSHLEVIDRFHRYGKNLRAYYSYWNTLTANATEGRMEPTRPSISLRNHP